MRREEVAVLAGMSSDFYARLEQARGSDPSASVVAALPACVYNDLGDVLYANPLDDALAGRRELRPGRDSNVYSGAGASANGDGSYASAGVSV